MLATAGAPAPHFLPHQGASANREDAVDTDNPLFRFGFGLSYAD